MTEPYWASGDGDVTLHLGKCEQVLPRLPANSVDAVVTDPPGAIRFMGREWDSDLGGRAQWVAWLTGCMTGAARVLKPGGHLLVWSIPRTSHWTAWALEDAGLEIRDCILHLFGSGFPKSLDVSKAIDRAAGVERDDKFGGALTRFAGPTGNKKCDTCGKWLVSGSPCKCPRPQDAAVTSEAQRWEGWGTALKPGQEIWWLARKPLAAGTIAANVLEFGTGALNIDGCKVEGPAGSGHWVRNGEMGTRGIYGVGGQAGEDFGKENPNGGRWPANVVFTHSAACGGVCAPDCPAGELDRQSGVTASRKGVRPPSYGATSGVHEGWRRPAHADYHDKPDAGFDDTGGASRFYPTFRYQAKAPASERPRLEDGTAHETVKPLGLMTWLVRLITPPGGTVLDLFAGSGPVAEACIIEGFRCVLIEQDPKSAALIRKRLSKPIQPVMFGLEG